MLAIGQRIAVNASRAVAPRGADHRRRALLPGKEQPLESLDQAVRGSLARFVAQSFQRRVKQLVDDPFDGALNALALFGIESIVLREELAEFILADFTPSGSKL